VTAAAATAGGAALLCPRTPCVEAKVADIVMLFGARQFTNGVKSTLGIAAGSGLFRVQDRAAISRDKIAKCRPVCAWISPAAHKGFYWPRSQIL
jgi:hypothetical protein